MRYFPFLMLKSLVFILSLCQSNSLGWMQDDDDDEEEEEDDDDDDDDDDKED